MEIKGKFVHYNFNVTDIARSLAFYEKALGLKPAHRKAADDGSFELVFLTDGQSPFELELTWLKDHPQPYDLGEEEAHLAFTVPGDYAAVRAFHRENGWICYENEGMGIYFIKDPDGYWLEILPERR